ncbi:hypothetical protein ILYODFUR_021453 [Ilyodon furcidens]|uniref:Uncharacterized protein n=1 Tax=Ilyodon furcidens TaxID=33524 RepID=A0ABV0TKR9_9TELE
MEQAPSAPSPPPKPVSHEPISFGIDQILGAGSEPESGRTPGRQSGSDLSNGDAYYSLGNPSGANAPSYTALSISLSGIMPPVEASGSYGENGNLGSRGVIRVPAHRPVTAPGPPAPVQSAVPGFGGLCFPWIGNRFAKDRISGRPAGRPNGIPSLIFDNVINGNNGSCTKGHVCWLFRASRHVSCKIVKNIYISKECKSCMKKLLSTPALLNWTQNVFTEEQKCRTGRLKQIRIFKK